MKLQEIFGALWAIVISNSCSGAPYEHHIMLPILQQQALRSYQQNRNRLLAMPSPASAKAASSTTPQQQLSPREKLSWSHGLGANARPRTGGSRKLKRQDLADQNGAATLAVNGPGGSKMMGRAMQADPNEFVDGLVPNGGPYSAESILSARHAGDTEQNADDDVDMEKKGSFKNWDEYKDVKSDMNMRTIGFYQDGPLQYTPVVDPDKHFRDVDKLFKKKNQRVKTFYDLSAFMKKQGKKFQFPTRTPVDKSQM